MGFVLTILLMLGGRPLGAPPTLSSQPCTGRG